MRQKSGPEKQPAKDAIRGIPRPTRRPSWEPRRTYLAKAAPQETPSRERLSRGDTSTTTHQ
jgi:hypothetical protein